MENAVNTSGEIIFDQWVDEVSWSLIGRDIPSFTIVINGKRTVTDYSGRQLLPSWHSLVDPRIVGNKQDGEKIVIIVADWGDEKGQRYNAFDLNTMSYLLPFWCSGVDYIRENCIAFHVASPEQYGSRIYTYFFDTVDSS